MTARLPFDPAQLDALLQARGVTSAPATLRRIGDGHSNLTYLLDDGHRRAVLRRPPPPPLPRGAHDVVREARILQALAATDVPVPAVLLLEQDTGLMGVPFYVMEHLDGAVCTDALPPAIDTPEQRAGVAEALVDALAVLHAVDWQAGLADLGRPDGFLERQLDRLPRLIAAPDGTLPEPFAAYRDELAATVPASSGAALIHGDLRLGNVMLASDPPARILGVLDWELAAIGDPLADVAYTLTTYAVPGVPLHAVSAMSRATLAEGFPGRDALAARYAERTGCDVTALPWHEAFQLFKLAVLYEYSRRRGEDAYYADPGHVAGLLDATRHALSSQRTPT
ncbi:phosphotransferase family protein [Paraconexibacter antarcticus]|uniref:Phosphotransferase family protein n=1 Tax=Paraconexibacter antarcticus TaxID=2949664 RepID=A0ABY5DM74_9ACTN|nr:phosphotransferase family protein [Paraconexibacter antarcticus]UTI62651.1 phosphotransferase family protein [Paraconexibacter antarcticus]